MDNKTAFFLALIIVGLLALDHFVLRWGVAFFLFDKIAGLIDQLAFWR